MLELEAPDDLITAARRCDVLFVLFYLYDEGAGEEARSDELKVAALEAAVVEPAIPLGLSQADLDNCARRWILTLQVLLFAGAIPDAAGPSGKSPRQTALAAGGRDGIAARLLQEWDRDGGVNSVLTMILKDLGLRTSMRRDDSLFSLLIPKYLINPTLSIFESHTSAPFPSFARTIYVPTTFGYLPPDLASEALSLPPTYDDPKEQASYERFLRSQAGESYDWYDDVLGFLEAFAKRNEQFVDKVKEMDQSGHRGH
ncbi:hypothetical protein RQP46_001526 [Phenoliferia psychrophenolica]